MLQYAETRLSVPRDGASQVIRETYESFQQQGHSFLGNGYVEFLNDTSKFSEFVEALSEGLEVENKEAFRTLCENARIDTLTEASMTTVSPVASLQGTMLRKFFPQLVVKDSMPTEVADKPRFWLTYMTPYYVDRNGTRHELPAFTKNSFTSDETAALTGLLPVYGGVIALTKLTDYNLLTGKNSAGSAVTDAVYGDAAGSSLATLAAAAVSLAGSNDRLDSKVTVKKVRLSFFNGYDDNAGTNAVPAADTMVDVAVNFPVDLNGNFRGEVSITVPASGTLNTAAFNDGAITVTHPVAIGASGTFAANADSSGYVDRVPAGTVIKGHIFGHVDFLTGIISAASTSASIVGLGFAAYVSSENNNYSSGVEFDIHKREVVIGTGEHMNAAIPVEYTKDLMAMYSIDGHVKIVDLLSTFLAQRTELEAFNFFKTSYTTNKLASAGYAGSFNCFPPREYAGRPQDYLEELKRVIDWYAQKMRNDTSYPGGSYVIMGNPLDTNLIKNISWSFRNSAGTEKEGVEVSYSVGTWQGGNLYTVIASENLPAGELRMYFFPSKEDQFTYKYYPYTFNVESGYRDPKKPNVPSLMMTKRHTFEEFTPMQTVITIQNNAGSLPPRSES